MNSNQYRLSDEYYDHYSDHLGLKPGELVISRTTLWWHGEIKHGTVNIPHGTLCFVIGTRTRSNVLVLTNHGVLLVRGVNGHFKRL